MSLALSRPRPAIDRPLLACLALDHENLPRVLAAMGFDERVMATPRGHIKWWQPAYLRMPEMGLIRARHGEAQAAQYEANTRAWFATLNRSMHDHMVYVMRRADPERIICVDTVLGEWRSPDNAVRGDDLIALASFMWGVGLAHSCHRLARVCGLAEAPVVNVG